MNNSREYTILFQNHYTHKIIGLELKRGLQLQFSGVSALIFITVTVFLFF